VLAQRDVWPERIRRLRRTEYDVLVEQGVFGDSRIELLLGALVEMSPQGPLHADVVARLAERLIRGLPSGVRTRVQSPLAVSEDSEPEPDIAVVASGDYRTAHPSRALLVVEVAETSLLKDRGIKRALYATAGIPEYWLVSLSEGIVEVHHQPSDGRYEMIQRVDQAGTLSPQISGTLQIPVADLFA
jgi:Uma2 family endonuclease